MTHFAVNICLCRIKNIKFAENNVIMTKNTTFPYKNSRLDKVKGVEYAICGSAAILHINSFSHFIENEMKYPAKFNGVLIIQCVRGSASFYSNLEEINLSENTLFIAPSSMLQFKSCDNCELFIIAFEEEFASMMNIDNRVAMPVLSLFSHSHFLVDENPRYTEYMRKGFESIYEPDLSSFEETQLAYYQLSLRHMLASLAYRIFSTLTTSKLTTKSIAPRDRSSLYFDRLMALLREHYRTERNVEFYADKMNLTPKHLSRVVRTFSGKTVHQWIDSFVVLEIKNLLRYSDLSIQQISYELNFPNPSFMGQYFRRVTGKTPGAYRKEL